MTYAKVKAKFTRNPWGGKGWTLDLGRVSKTPHKILMSTSPVSWGGKKKLSVGFWMACPWRLTVPLSGFGKMTMVSNRGSLSFFATIFIVLYSFQGDLSSAWWEAGLSVASSTLLTPGSDPSVLLLRLLGIIAPSSGFLSLNYIRHLPLCLLAFALQANPPPFWLSFTLGIFQFYISCYFVLQNLHSSHRRQGGPPPLGTFPVEFFMFFLPKYFIFFQQAPMSDLVFTRVMQWPNSAL